MSASVVRAQTLPAAPPLTAPTTPTFAPTPAPTTAPAPAPLSPADELKDVNWVGFQQFADISRVFVRTSDPVQFQVRRISPYLVELILQNARVPIANNTRFLDTTYFDSPVRFIQPRVIEGPSASVRIEIHLKRPTVNYKEVQRDTLLALDFSRQPVE